MLLNLLLEGTTESTTKQGGGIGSWIIMGVLLLGIIGLFVWSNISNKKKKKAEQEMVTSLKIGDRVMTIGGVCGFVAQINDAENSFVLETGLEDNKSFIKFDKRAIYQTAPAQGAANAPVEKKAEVKEEKKEEAVVEEKKD